MWGLFSAYKPSISPPATDYPTKINAICEELDALHGRGSALASAATVDLSAATGSFLHITGNTGPITSLGTPPAAGRRVTVVCDSTPTFTHHATNLIMPGGVNYTAAAGDSFVFVSEATGWRCVEISSSAPNFVSVNVQTTLNIGGSLSLTGLSDHFMRGGAALYWNSTGASGGTTRAAIVGSATSTLDLYAGSTPTKVGVFAATGLTITGDITSSANILSSAVTQYISNTSATPGTMFIGSTAANTPVSILVNNSTIGTFSSTGLEVTGAVKATAPCQFNGGINQAAGATGYIAMPSLNTAATSGFLQVTSCAGTPTGVPANPPSGASGYGVVLVYDTTNNYLYAYNGGWKKINTAWA